jgi:AcrR family transcriptional regulator
MPIRGPVPRTRAEKQSARRDAILEAALDEFCEKGFSATRVEAIARRADVGKGTIYLNFQDKEALFQELIRSRLGSHILRLERARPEPGQSMRDTIEAAIAPLLQQIRTRRVGNLLRLMIAEAPAFPSSPSSIIARSSTERCAPLKHSREKQWREVSLRATNSSVFPRSSAPACCSHSFGRSFSTRSRHSIRKRYSRLISILFSVGIVRVSAA